MTLDQMRVVQAVVENGSILAATRIIHKSQPAISNMICRLESELGIALFTRDTYRLKLTGEGEVIYEQIKNILQQHETVNMLARNFASGNESLIRLSLEILCPLPPVVTLLNALQANFPATKVVISMDTLGGGIDKLSKGQVDIAVSPAMGISESMQIRLFDHAKLVPVFGCDHPVILASQSIDKTSLRKFTQFVIPDSSSKQADVRKLIFAGQKQWCVPDFRIKIELIKQGLGWGYVPEHLILEELQTRKLVIATSDDVVCKTVPLYVAKDDSVPTGPVAAHLFDALMQYGLNEKGSLEQTGRCD